MQEKIALAILAYWGYTTEFDPMRYDWLALDQEDRKLYVERKRKSHSKTVDHANKLAKIAINIMQSETKG